MLYSRCYQGSCLCYIICYVVVSFPLLCLDVHLAGRPSDAPAQTPAAFVPSSSRPPSQAPEERDVDWEDYNYELEPAAGGGSQAENSLAALLAGIPDFKFNTEDLEACCATYQDLTMLIKLQA